MAKGWGNRRLRHTPKSEIKCPRCGGHHIQVRKVGDQWTALCTQCRKRWPYEPKQFMGESMTCAICGKQRHSDPNINSDWRYLELDERGYYVCTDHFPPDGSSQQAFANAYIKVLANLASRDD